MNRPPPSTALCAAALLAAAPLGAAPVADFLGVDGALSWTESDRILVPAEYGGDMLRALLDGLVEADVRLLRDRIGWCSVEKNPGEYSFKGVRLDPVADLCAERGIRLLVCFDNALPGWEPDGGAGVSTNLVAVYRVAREIAAHFAGRVTGYEILNERDASGSDVAWDTAAFAKAAALGFRAGDPACRVLPPSACLPKRGPFDAGLLANGLGLYVDAFNLHRYTGPSSHDEAFADLRALLGRAGLSGMEVVVTETGCDIEGPAEEVSCKPPIKMHSPRQAELQAEYYVKNQLSLMMHGVSESYFFFYGAYEERNNRKDWGMIRRDGAKKPVYHAMNELSFRVGEAELLGEAALGGGVKGFLFRHPDESLTLVYWRLSRVDTGVGDLYADEGAVPFTLAIDGKVSEFSAVRMPRYADFPAGASIPVARLPEPTGRGGPPDPGGRDLSIVLRLDYNRGECSATGGKSLLEMLGDEATFRLSAWNISGEAKRGVVRASGGAFKGLPDGEIEIPPFGVRVFDVHFRPEGWTDPDGRLVFTGEFGGRPVTPLSVPVAWYGGDALASLEAVEPDVSDPAAWRFNSNAMRQSAAWNEGEGAMEFAFDFDPANGDKWFYPFFNPGKGVLDGAVVVEFEVRSEQDKVENDYNCALLMVGGQWLKMEPPRKVWEKRRVSLANAGLGDGLECFQIGANPRGSEVRYFVRHLRILRRPTAPDCGAAGDRVQSGANGKPPNKRAGHRQDARNRRHDHGDADIAE